MAEQRLTVDFSLEADGPLPAPEHVIRRSVWRRPLSPRSGHTTATRGMTTSHQKWKFKLRHYQILQQLDDSMAKP